MTNRYERYFSNRLYDNLPSSDTGLLIQDVDFVLQNYKTRKFLFIELKTRGNKLTFPQRQFYNMLHKRLNNYKINDGRKYIGTRLIEFENDNFDDGRVKLNGKLIKQYELQEKLGVAMGYKLKNKDLF